MSTPDAVTLRRKLYEALGGTVTRGPWDDVMHGYAWTATWPGGEDLEWLPAETVDNYWTWLAISLTTAVPNWPVDDGEALALCLDISGRRGWDLVIYKASALEGEVTVCKFYVHRDGRPQELQIGYALMGVALCLSKLALAALEAEAQP